MTQELKRYGFYRFIKRFTLPLIVVLFLIYCFTDKALWTDFNGYVKSFGAPARQAVLAILMFLAVLYLLRLFRGWFVQKILLRLRLRPSSQEALTSALSYISVLIALLVGLSVFGVNLRSLGLLISALSVGLGLGFGLQHIVNNFISGILIMFERPFRIGDWIVVNDKEGIVYKINIRSTELETFDRAIVIIPNADIISGQLINWTLTDAGGRISIDVGVGYASDLAKALDIALDIAKSDPRVLTDPAPSAIVTEFADSAINIRLRCYLSNILERSYIKSDLMIRLQKAFAENGIDIPFPQRVVQVLKD